MVLLEMLDCLIYRSRLEAITLNELESNLQVFHLLLQFCYLLRLLFDDLLLICINCFASTMCPFDLLVFTCDNSDRWISLRLEKYACFEISAKLHDVIAAKV